MADKQITLVLEKEEFDILASVVAAFFGQDPVLILMARMLIKERTDFIPSFIDKVTDLTKQETTKMEQEILAKAKPVEGQKNVS